MRGKEIKLFTGHKFSREMDKEFTKTLKSRVNEYFKMNNISKHANANMVVKTLFMLSLYFVPYFLMIFGVVQNPWLIYSMWLIMGLGMAGIGMCIMHDANHGAYSKYPRLNKILGYTMNLIGANANNWKIQHNVLHHTYTNIAEVDEDLNTPSLLRFAPSKDYRKIHRFQHLYAWFFYGILSLNWVTFKDFKQMRRYRTMGLLNKGKSNTKNLIDLLIWKLIYYSYIIVIPLIVLPTPWWLVVLGFVSLHFVTGSVLSIIFQAAHVMPDIQFPLPNEEGNIDNNWTVHQLLTTTNFASKSKVFSWMIGGLNYQVEHHLFSNICHVHYPRISKIVAETAKEYGVPYNMEGSFVRVIGKHIQLLKDLGRSQDYLKMA